MQKSDDAHKYEAEKKAMAKLIQQLKTENESVQKITSNFEGKISQMEEDK